MNRLLRLFSGKSHAIEPDIRRVREHCDKLANSSDESLRTTYKRSKDLLEIIAIGVVMAARVLAIPMFDVQLHGAIAMAQGNIAEMQTGEGKTLAAVPAVLWFASQGNGVHVMTANDYLSRRDAEWMGGIYEKLGLSVGCIQQGMTAEERRRAYTCDVTYSTANEVGFDFLRDQIALYPEHQVHRPFATAVVDEADSILIDEARIPLVIAGAEASEKPLAHAVDHVVRQLRRLEHFTLDTHGRNVNLTDAGIAVVESAFACGNLFDDKNLVVHTAVQDSLHAHVLLLRDVDYLVRNSAIESIDEFKGRVVEDRRWPAGLHTAIEAKERVPPKEQGRILGSITLQNLISLYPRVCGMTGTAATQADEFREIYGMDVAVIPTNRPMIRVDFPDCIFETKVEKENAVVEAIRSVHATGQPVLVGTASVEESERLSNRLEAQRVPHCVLNARNDEQEAAIIARAGERGAVTISTNMAGRGTDIRLGEGVVELGGLYVIGTNKHESCRVDNQLRGRAGRQGDPGQTQFFVSLEDPLLVKFGIDDPNLRYDPPGIQRLVEGQNYDTRKFLHRYERIVESQRQMIAERRQAILEGPCESDIERLVSLRTIDDLWSDYLTAIKELREGIQWVSLGTLNPIDAYVRSVHTLFESLQTAIEEEIPRRIKEAEANGIDPAQRGATWTYLTTDQPFGSMYERILRGVLRKAESKRFWG
jgi:preprotein translocase subunit SecA